MNESQNIYFLSHLLHKSMANISGQCMDKMKPKEHSRILGSNNFHSHFDVIFREAKHEESSFFSEGVPRRLEEKTSGI